MNKKYLLLGIVVLTFVIFFFPKEAGSSGCGGPCPIGIGFKEEYACVGFKTIEPVIDGELVKCYGYTYKTGKCLGYNNESELVELPCRQ